MKKGTRKSFLPRTALKSFLVLLFGAWTAASYAAPTIGTVTANAGSVPQYSKFELTFPITTWATNLFDPNQISVSATFTGPSGQTYVINGFAYQNYTRSGSVNGQTLSASGPVVWKVRFAPPVTGIWSYSLSATDTGGTSTQPGGTFQATAGSNHGFVSVSSFDARYFTFSDGTAFFPVGENMTWDNDANGKSDNTYCYDNYLSKLAAQGGNYVRIWMANYGFGIENNTLGSYDMDKAWALDEVFNTAESDNLYIQLCLNAAVQFDPNNNFSSNPYNSANGGPLSSADAVWANTTAQQYMSQRWRYITARWGYSTSLMDYELFNEVDDSYNYSAHMTNDIPNWHANNKNILNSLNPQKHMVATSFSTWNLANQNLTWANMDFTQTHQYDNSDEAVMMQNSVPYYENSANGKYAPFFAGEMGTTWNWTGPSEQTEDPNGLAIHNVNWGSLMTNAAGGGFIWWWDSYVDPYNHYPQWKGISAFVAGEDLDKRGYSAQSVTPGNANGQPLRCLYLRGSQKVLGWVQNTNNEWYAQYNNGASVGSSPAPTVQLTGLSPNGNWQLQWWNTSTGAIYQTTTAMVSGGTANLAVPAMSGTNPDWAFKLISAPVTASTWRVVAGGNQYTDSQGNVWSADTQYIGGSTAASTNAIAGALPGSGDQALYQTERWGSPFQYVFNVPAGSYQVTLKFAETKWTAAGQRVFNVSVNGNTVLANFDIYAAAGGANKGVDEIFNSISGNGGAVTITLGPASVDNAKVDAIQVIPQPALLTPTNTPTATATWTLTSIPTKTFTLTPTFTPVVSNNKPPYPVVCYVNHTNKASATSLAGSSGPAINWTTDVPWKDITVVVDAFLNPNSNDTFSNAGAQGAALINPAHSNGVRCCVALTAGSLATLCLPANQAAFASAVTAMMMQSNYDGVEVDWEVTGAATQANATNMMVALYNAIKALPNSSVDGKPRTLSFTTNPAYSNIYNMTTLGNYTDWCFYMGYDWYDNPASYANGPLNGVNPSIAGNIQSLTNGSQWSYPISKMILGCPLYTNDYNAGTYYDVLSILHLGTPGAYNTSYAEQAYTAPDGNTVYVDTAQSYCDKINWALGSGLKGIGLWDMAQALPYTDSLVGPIWNTIAGQAACLNLGPTATPTKTATPIVVATWRINAGGPQYTDSQGNVWSADTQYAGGTTASTTNAVSGALPGAADQTLYQTERYGDPFSYSFNVPAGAYQITLKFAETYWTAAGQRVFNVSVNGTTVLTNFDIFKTAGAMNKAVDEVFNNIAPSGGTITITLGSASVDNAKVDAIQIIPQAATPTNTPTMTASKTLTATSTPTSTMTMTSTATTASTSTNTSTMTATGTNTVVNTSTSTSSPTVTVTGSFTPVMTATPTMTNTATSTAMNTTTRTSTNSPVNTSTPTMTHTSTSTRTNTPIYTATPTFSFTPTKTWTTVFTVTSTATNTTTPTLTSTFTFTATKVPFTSTPTKSLTSTPSWTGTPTRTATPASACAGIPEWNGNFIAYSIGQKVQYNGEEYQCIQAHSSESTWEPNIVPALWKDLGPCGSSAPAAVVASAPVAYPNPATGDSTTIALPMATASQVSVQIYTVAMRLVRTINVGQVNGENVTLRLVDKGGVQLANGIYYFRVQANGQGWTVKVLILR